MVGACACSNEALGSIKLEEFLNYLANCLLLRKDYAPYSYLKF